MERGKAYTRKMRAKHIKRKKALDAKLRPWGQKYGGWYHGIDGKYSKGKIHCSCPLCSAKAYYGHRIPTMQELRNPNILEKDLEEMEETKTYMESSYCYKECEIGKQKYNELDKECESVFDLASDFHDFISECCKTCKKFQENESNI